MPSMSDDLTLIPRTHVVEEGRNDSLELSSDFCTSTQVQAHVNSNVKKLVMLKLAKAATVKMTHPEAVPHNPPMRSIFPDEVEFTFISYS